MNQGRTLFAQLTEFACHKELKKCVRKDPPRRRPHRFSFWGQFLAMALAQLTYRRTLRDVEPCLSTVPDKLYHMGFRGPVARATLAGAKVAGVRVLDVLIPEPCSSASYHVSVTY